MIPTLHLIGNNFLTYALLDTCLLSPLSFLVGFCFTPSRNNSSKLLFADDVAAVELDATLTGKSSYFGLHWKPSGATHG